MDSSIKQIVKIINEIGTIEVLFDTENNSLIYDEILKKRSDYEIHFKTSYERICSIVEEHRSQTNEILLDNLLDEIENLILVLQKKFFEIRKNYPVPVSNDIKNLLTAIEFKIKILNQLIEFFEFEKKYKLNNLPDNVNLDSFIELSEKDKFNKWQKYYLLEKLGCIKTINTNVKLLKNQHKAIGKLFDLHEDNVKKLHLKNYKGRDISTEEKDEVDKLLQIIGL